MKVNDRQAARRRRHRRVRRKVSGTAGRPRMAVMFSNRNIYVQLIDDEAQRTLCSVSGTGGARMNMEAAKALGTQLAEQAKDKSIINFVVDRAGFKYHGRLQAIVEAAIEGGLQNAKNREN